MKNMNDFIDRINFKKVIAIYIVLAIAIGVFSAGFLAYVYKDKLISAYDFDSLSEKVERGKLGIDAMKSEILSLAKRSNDIVDILILNNNNKVIYSAKQSEFGHGTFNLKEAGGERERYLTYLNNPDVSFRLTHNDDFMLDAGFAGHEREIGHHHKDENFFRNNFRSKKIYLLSYAINRNNGDKVYFISDVHPVPNGELYIDIAGNVFLAFVILYWILLAIWVYQNARKSKIDAVLWGAIALVTNLVGLFVYLIYKQSNKTCYKCNTLQSKNNIFCKYCGTKIANACQSCSKIINEEDNFCSSCGNKINIE